VSSIAETGAGRRSAPDRRLRRLAAAGIFIALFCGGFVWSMSLGPQAIGVRAIVHGTFTPNDSVDELIVHLIRLPRALASPGARSPSPGS
jgi:hypothetical protein